MSYVCVCVFTSGTCIDLDILGDLCGSVCLLLFLSLLFFPSSPLHNFHFLISPTHIRIDTLMEAGHFVHTHKEQHHYDAGHDIVCVRLETHLCV